jgi:hypothetical protein
MSEKITRRDVMRRAAYIAPVIMSLKVSPSYATSGSGNSNHHDWQEKLDQWKDTVDWGDILKKVQQWFGRRR